MSGINGVSSAAFQMIEGSWDDQARTPAKQRPAPKVTGGRKTKSTVTIGGTMKDGGRSSAISVKVGDDGKLSTTVGHDVTLPVGKAKVKLGAKYTRRTDLKRLIQWFFWLFGRSERPQPKPRG